MAVLKKHQRLTYTPIDNQALRDEALSWKATGLLAYLLSLPDDWRINVTDLANRKTDGRTATSSAMGELEDCGYVIRTKVRDESGRFHTTVHCAESPDLLREIVDQPTLDLPTAEEPTVGEPQTTKEPLQTTDIRNNHQNLLAPKPARNEVWDALADVFGEPTTESNRSLRGKLVRSLAGAGATEQEIKLRVQSWPLHFPDATLTETAFEKHYDRLGRDPARASEADVEKYQAEVRRIQREKRAQELDAQSRGLPG